MLENVHHTPTWYMLITTSTYTATETNQTIYPKSSAVLAMSSTTYNMHHPTYNSALCARWQASDLTSCKQAKSPESCISTSCIQNRTVDISGELKVGLLSGSKENVSQHLWRWLVLQKQIQCCNSHTAVILCLVLVEDSQHCPLHLGKRNCHYRLFILCKSTRWTEE